MLPPDLACSMMYTKSQKMESSKTHLDPKLGSKDGRMLERNFAAYLYRPMMERALANGT
jgi:hypothetical protein